MTSILVLAVRLGMVVLANALVRFSTVQIVSNSLFVIRLEWTVSCRMLRLWVMFRVWTPTVTIVLKPSVVRVLTARQLHNMFRKTIVESHVLAGVLHRVVSGRSK